MDELPCVLWTYFTTPRRSTEETPFSMTYGSKAIIPFEAGFPTLKTDQFQVDKNDLLHAMSLELIDERREVAMVKMAHYQQKLRQGYDKRVGICKYGIKESSGNNEESIMGEAGS